MLDEMNMKSVNALVRRPVWENCIGQYAGRAQDARATLGNLLHFLPAAICALLLYNP